MAPQPRFVFTCWYGEAIAARADATTRSRITVPTGLRGLRAWRRGDVLVASAGDRITNLYIAFALLLSRRLVLLEAIEPEHTGRGLRALVHELRVRVLRRSGAHVQCATAQERDRFIGHGFAPERVHLLRWPDRMDADDMMPLPAKEDGLVVASGRRTDWPTLFAAADGQGWRLTVICADADLGAVRELARRHDPDALVLSEISLDEHHAWVARAAVYCLVLPPDVTGSIGQVRLMNAATAAAAVVLTRSAALEDYPATAGTLLVEPSDPDAVRAAVNDLLADPGRRERQAAQLVARSPRTMGDHLDDILGLLVAL